MEENNKKLLNIFISLLIMIILSIIIHLQKIKYIELQFLRNSELLNRSETLKKLIEEKTEELRETNLNLKKLQKKILNAKENEVKRIARELHDNSLQEISYLGIQLGLIQRKFNDHKLNNNDLKEVIFFNKEIANTIRGIAHSIHPSILERISLEEAVKKYISQYKKDSDILDDIKLKEVEELLDYDERIAVYRVIQEAFINSIKYL